MECESSSQKVAEIEQSVAQIQPDIAILGDDNAFSLMAQHLVDRKIPPFFSASTAGRCSTLPWTIRW